MIMRWLFLFVLTFVSMTLPAHADDYLKPSWPDLVHTLIRFNAINVTDPSVLDEYALITECDLYRSFYRDDFKWNKVRQALLQSIKDNVATYPTRYSYVAMRQLDRYDFQSKTFKFTEKSKISNVNSFVIYSVVGDGCDAGRVRMLPRTFRAAIAEPVYMDGLPLGEQDAKNMLEFMNAHGNSERMVWLRFNLRVTYIEALQKVPDDTLIDSRGQKSFHYQQLGGERLDSLKLDSRVESIEAFEDEALTKLVYSLQL